jgi:hypothetical protein
VLADPRSLRRLSLALAKSPQSTTLLSLPFFANHSTRDRLKGSPHDAASFCRAMRCPPWIDGQGKHGLIKCRVAEEGVIRQSLVSRLMTHSVVITQSLSRLTQSSVPAGLSASARRSRET